MPIPHQEMRRIVKRRIQGLEGSERIRVLRESLDELPGYYQGPYGQLRKWILSQIDEAQLRRAATHQETYFLPRQGAAQIALVGPPNAGKSSLLHALSGRQVRIGDYPFTTLRPVDGMVMFEGAGVQLVDLPGLLDGAADGRGGGRSVLAAARVADALLLLSPLTPEGSGDSRRVAQELRLAAIELPIGVVATKLDLEGARERLPALESDYPGNPIAACSARSGEGIEGVRQLIFSLSGLMRVFCKPRGAKVSRDAVVLAGSSTVASLVEALNRRWLSDFRAAHVTGRSARFPHQAVGLEHVLSDGDVVELVIG